MTQREVVIGLDLGTTGVKAVALTARAEAVADGEQEYALASPEPGWAEQDPAEVLAAAEQVLADTAARAADAGATVVGIALSAAMHAVMGLDTDHQPITALVTWADERSLPQVHQLREQGLAVDLQRRTGTPVHPMSPLPKLLWLAEHEPDLFAAAAHWVGMKELVLHRLTGRLVVDRSVASATGLRNLDTGAWDEAALDLVGVRPDQLAEQVGTTDVVGGLTEDAAQRLGLPVGLEVVAGASDGACANLGIGAVRPGVVGISIGTSAALRAVSDTPRVDPDGAVFCYLVAEGRYLVGGALNNGGNVLRWVRDALAPDLAEDSADAQLTELAATAPAGSDGLLVLPFLHGERAPRWQGGERGAILGLTAGHRREHLVRAHLEGVCLQLRRVLEAVRAAGVEPVELRATGGFARSEFWRQLLADVLGEQVGYQKDEQGSAAGAALMGLVGLGRISDLDAAADLATVAATCQPGEQAQVYAALIEPFRAAADAVVALTTGAATPGTGPASL